MFYISNFHKNKHYVSADDLIDKVYTYEYGYDESMKDVISEEAFLKVNSYRFYEDKNFKMPISIDVKLNELNQKKIDGKIAVYFEYDEFIYDRDGNEISGTLKCPAVAFILEREDKLYIEDVQLYENNNEVPKEYK